MTGSSRIFISVAEDSADVHAAALVRRTVELLPDCHFYGLTGPRLRALGVETIADLTSHAAMLGGVLGMFRPALRTVRQVEESWQAAPPDLVVLLDSPELHLGVPELGLKGLAPRAKALGTPVLYYIAPQTWASRDWRNRWVARYVDRLACILPFEEVYFRRHGIRAEYVGHPLFETLRGQAPDPGLMRRIRGVGSALRGSGSVPPSIGGLRPWLHSVAPPGPVVALLPGSRRGVIDRMLPRQLEVVRVLGERGLAPRVCISCVAEDRLEQIRRHAEAAHMRVAEVIGGKHKAGDEARAGRPGDRAFPVDPVGAVAASVGVRRPTRRSDAATAGVWSAAPLDARLPGTAFPVGTASAVGAAPRTDGVVIVIGDNASLLAAADLVLVASGTATLEAAHHRRPMIVMYDAGPVLGPLYRPLGWLAMHSPHLSLVNVLAGRRVVPEFMPHLPDVEPVASVAQQLLADESWQALMVRQMEETIGPLEASEASTRVCEIIREMVR
jgi:lipid A disaccharide synthetase